MKNSLFAVVAAFAVQFTLFSQALTSVSGTISDASGAVVVGADVEAVNMDTQLTRTTKTDNSGVYAFPQIIPGTYRIKVTSAGFRSATVNDGQLLVNNPATVHVTLEIGQTTETVSVSAETEHLNTVDASIGNAIANKPIVQLPLNARNIVGLLALQPGVV